MTLETPDFANLYDLLRTRGISPGTLATAIENGGIYGWDRYGRFQHFECKEPEVHPALNVLAGHARHEDDPNSPSPFDDEGSDAYRRFGWLANKLPDFAAIESQHPPEPKKPKINAKTENSTLAIVGGLLMFIKGNLSAESHPEFKSEDQLIELMVKHLRGYAGMSSRNLQDKFAAAKKRIDLP